ncbi:MAG: AAA family ATPase [Bifidobacteriaceae bacterium]|jgi:predicted AAA+ superfamily ATPase|nr:AAA family ATPase [Bifidobacteriaceae bacterium]
MEITRIIFDDILEHLKPGKVTVLYGSRRTGKTTITEQITQKYNDACKIVTINGDLKIQYSWLTSENLDIYKSYLDGVDLLVIDEAQMFNNIGHILKIIVDAFPNLKVLATGSSSFELANQIGEPLIGRKWQYTLYPISISELYQSKNTKGEIKDNLENQLIYGMYPQILLTSNNTDKLSMLLEIVEGQLYKDILSYKKLKNPDLLHSLLKLLAWQIGKEVKVHELATSLKVSSETISLYLDLLEKVFLIRKVNGFSSANLRKEISKSSRYYFVDNGVRNAVINNFSDLSKRAGDEIGMLWENFIVMERLKNREYFHNRSKDYFWRTYSQQEIDLVEVVDGEISAFEFKYNSKTSNKNKIPSEWKKNYPDASFKLIDSENYLEWLL